MTPMPLLQSGDRLTRSEFERRYSAMPRTKKAELIEGVVYLPSPVSTTRHGEAHLRLGTWLGSYAAKMRLVCADNTTVRLDADNEPQPDLVLCLPAERGGATRISSEGYLEGPPELVAEVAASSVSIDLYDKLQVYRRNGVREYLVWRVNDAAIDWFVLRDGVYEVLPVNDGVVRSSVFPGLWLASDALLAGDALAVLAKLEAGLASARAIEFGARQA